MPFSTAVQDRERDKFIERPSGETAVRVFIANDSSEPIEVTGESAVTSPTGPIKITTAVITDVASNPIPVPQINRVSLIVRNRDTVNTVYVGPNNTVTPDDNATTGGWEVGPAEDFALAFSDDNSFYMVTAAGKTAVVKFLELASTGPGGVTVTGTRAKETPIGAVNGSNVSFAVTQTPLGNVYFDLFLDGLLLTNTTHYTRVGTIITMVSAPLAGQELEAVYWY